jgi:hypothetical protein
MKKFLLHLMLAVCALGLNAAHGAPRLPIDGVKVSYNLIGTPQLVAQIPGMAQKRPRIAGPGEPAPIWLEVESDFDCFNEFPELSVKYSLLVKVGAGPLKVIEGEVIHVDVAPGKERHSVMYIPPKSLNRLAENKQFALTSVKAAFVEISSKGELINAGQKVSGGITYAEFTKQRDAIEKVTDAFLNKQQTPFAPLFYDYYEAVKPLPR